MDPDTPENHPTDRRIQNLYGLTAQQLNRRDCHTIYRQCIMLRRHMRPRLHFFPGAPCRFRCLKSMNPGPFPDTFGEDAVNSICSVVLTAVMFEAVRIEKTTSNKTIIVPNLFLYIRSPMIGDGISDRRFLTMNSLFGLLQSTRKSCF